MKNPLENIKRENKDSSFLFLEVLCLTNTMVNNWVDVDALRNFKSLTKVKLIGIPLVSRLKEAKARELVLARLPNIECLNGSRVTNTEREKAERNFIREYVNDQCPPERYHELVAIHGRLAQLADVNLHPVDYANVIMKITGRAPYLETISTRQTVGDFKKYLSNMLGIPAKTFAVYSNDMEVDYPPDELRYNSRKLSSYKIKDGDEIYVNIFD